MRERERESGVHGTMSAPEIELKVLPAGSVVFSGFIVVTLGVFTLAIFVVSVIESVIELVAAARQRCREEAAAARQRCSEETWTGTPIISYQRRLASVGIRTRGGALPSYLNRGGKRPGAHETRPRV